jgi:predicted NBD/HSP70 family sugar kinase
MLDTRQREIVRTLWEQGRLSRWELHERTGLTPNNVGGIAEALLATGVLREGSTEPTGAGRPRVPLEIDPSTRQVLGLAIGPGRVEVCRVGLRGHPIGSPVSKSVDDPAKVIPSAATLLKKIISDDAMAIGLSVTGFVDPSERAVLLSSAFPGKSGATLAPIYDAAGDLPVVLENNMHALAARWLLTHRAAGQDVLLVLIEDGQLGAAMLIDGRPNRGCATGANELGHFRFFVDTAKCYCGHSGCLERIVSSDFLRRQRNGAAGSNTDGLLQSAARFSGLDASDPALETVLKYLSCGLANIVNFVRPHRLVLVSPMTRSPALSDALVRMIRGDVLAELADRVKIDFWDEPAAGSAETAGWLALAELFFGGWGAEVARRGSEK